MTSCPCPTSTTFDRFLCPIGQVLLVILLGRYCQGGFYMIDERSIARRIREERRKAGISQDCLGKKLGVDGFYISKLENNKKGLSLNMIAEISKALNVSADYLIFGNDLRKDGLEDKLATVLHGCSDNERKVLYEAICALKRILINNRYDK